MLEDVGLSLNLLKIFVQHRATMLAQQCCTMLASFEQAFTAVSMKVFLKYSINSFDESFETLKTCCILDKLHVEYISHLWFWYN